jgi:hypothetical protein
LCFYQVTEGDEVSDRFKDWLDKKLEYLRICASYAAPEDFPKDVVWNWEVCLPFLFLIGKGPNYSLQV